MKLRVPNSPLERLSADAREHNSPAFPLRRISPQTGFVSRKAPVVAGSSLNALADSTRTSRPACGLQLIRILSRRSVDQGLRAASKRPLSDQGRSHCLTAVHRRIDKASFCPSDRGLSPPCACGDTATGRPGQPPQAQKFSGLRPVSRTFSVTRSEKKKEKEKRIKGTLPGDNETRCRCRAHPDRRSCGTPRAGPSN